MVFMIFSIGIRIGQLVAALSHKGGGAGSGGGGGGTTPDVINVDTGTDVIQTDTGTNVIQVGL